MRSCFLHVGTHKTGTTALQMLLARNAGTFLESGVLYPKTGRLAPPDTGNDIAHHNIAWELAGDARFTAAGGTFAQLLEEIRDARTPAVVLSSEDFEYLYQRPGVLTDLAAKIRGAGCEPKVVLYVRSQADYAESLYAQLVKYHGLACSFEAFLEEITSHGAVHFGGWIFCFDYALLANAFADAFGRESVVVRSYAAGSSADALFADFTALVADGLDFRKLEKPGRLHRAPAFADVLEALHANVAAQFPDAPTVQTLARELFPSDRKSAYLRGRFDILGDRDAQRFQQSFAPSNLALQAGYGARVPDPAKRSRLFGRRDAEKRQQLFATATKRWRLPPSP